MSLQDRTVSRRSFVKAFAATAAAGAAMAALPGSAGAAGEDASSVFIPANAANEGDKESVYGYCSMCMCVGNCNFVASVKDGVVVNVEGDPARATNDGTLCPRGKGMIMNLYNPHRIKAPMKRTNPEKGVDVDPGWVEITWDEAFDIAAEKIQAVLDDDPRKMVNFFGFAAYEAASAAFGLGVWAHLLGTPNIVSTNGEMCDLHYGGLFTIDSFPTVNYDPQYAEYVVMLGRGLGADYGDSGGGARSFARNIRTNRTKYVFVAPRASMESSRGEWVPARQGYDLALVYAWLHCMLYEIEEGFDKEFVKNRTNAPYLIDANGDYLVNEDGKPMLWDMSSNSAKTWDDPTLADPALEGKHTVNGKSCTVAFQLFKESLKDFTPEWAEPLTDVPAAKIREIVNDLVAHAHFGETIDIDGVKAPLRPAAVIIGRGDTNQEDGTLTDIFSRVLNILLGNIATPGGLICSAFNGYMIDEKLGVIKPYLEAATCESFSWPPQMIDFGDSVYPHRHCTCTMALQAMLDPKKYGFEYEPSLMVSSGSNPILSSACPDTAIAAIKKMDYVIYANCYHMNEMAMLSDLLLPENSKLEGHVAYYFPGSECCSAFETPNFVEDQRSVMMRKGIDPIFNTMDGSDIYIELFDRMGQTDLLTECCNAQGVLGWSDMFNVPEQPWPPSYVPPENHKYDLKTGKKYTIQDYYDMNLKSVFGGDKGLDHLDKVKFMPYKPLNNVDRYATLRHKENFRFPVYLEAQKRSGDFLIPNLERVQKEEFDLEGTLGIDIAEFRRRYTALPYWPEKPRLIESEPEEFDLYAYTFRLPSFIFRLGSCDQDPIRRYYSEHYDPEFDAVLIHTQTAAERGIKMGDKVQVTSNYGTTTGHALVTERTRPESIGIGGCTGRRTMMLGDPLASDTNYNNLMSDHMGHRDPIGGGIITTVRVKVEKVS